MWYLIVFLWLVDRVVFSCYLIVCYSSKEVWSNYKSKNDGRRIFQIDLAPAVIKYGITLDWKELFNDEDRPGWMRTKPFVPCACRHVSFITWMKLMAWNINQNPEKKQRKI